MATKPRKRSAAAVGQAHELDVMNAPGHPEFDVGETVTVRMSEGMADLWPASFDRLPAERRELAGELMMLVGRRRALGRDIDDTVRHMRGHHGFSWGQIGWCVGMSAEGARLRWGGNNLPTAHEDSHA